MSVLSPRSLPSLFEALIFKKMSVESVVKVYHSVAAYIQFCISKGNAHFLPLSATAIHSEKNVAFAGGSFRSLPALFALDVCCHWQPGEFDTVIGCYDLNVCFGGYMKYLLLYFA